MGLTLTFQEGAVTTFAAFGDLIKSATYTRTISNPAYNPLTGAITADEESFTAAFLFERFDAEDDQGTYRKAKDMVGENVLPTDQRASIPCLNMKNTVGTLVDPEMDDTIVKADSSRWKVIRIRTDPASALWEMQIRRIS